MEAWTKNYEAKIMPAELAVDSIQSGNRVVIGHACGEPQMLVEALVNKAEQLRNVQIVHMVAMGAAKYAQPGLEESFRHNALFVGASTRKAIAANRGDYTPCFFHEIPRLFKSGTLPVDVALIQIATPDADGYASLGVSVDYTLAAAECAKIVIAQVNSHMPRTAGSKIHLDKITYLVKGDMPIIELQPPIIGDIEKNIGKNVACLIPDGATLQLGIGAIPDAVLLFLKDKKGLGIHSEMFSDGVVELVEAGVIDNSKKNLHPNKFIATFLMGSKRLYEFVHNNPAVEMWPVDYVNDPYIAGKNAGLISINSALQVDLMGQVNAEMIGHKQFSGIGGQVDFIRAASRSLGGKSIIALPATAAQGTISRITCELDKGAAVSTSRNDVHYVVTEFGSADLRGKTLKERALALISIAHPHFREKLLQTALEQKLL